MRITRNSMISVAAAAVLMAGFTGCSSDTNNVTEGSKSTSTSTTGGNNDTVTNPKVTVTGTVMDTNGNPLSNVTVYVAGMKTTTDEGGIYTFDEVPTVNTANSLSLSQNTTANGALQVTITAPAGYLGATVLVTPESQQISSGDPAVLNGGQTNPNTNFIDGYIASAGTAVLPELSGTVYGVLENALNGSRIVGVEVCLDLTQTSFDGLDNSTATAMGNVSYATPSFCATTVEGGVFNIGNAPVDANLAYDLADWNLALGQATNVTVKDSLATNIGELLVTPIITADTIAPMVASVVEGLNPNTNGTARMMLVDDARTEFTLNFSEAINVDSDGSALPDTDMTSSVTVYIGATPSTMQRVNATAVYSGDQLTVTLDTPLTDGQLVDVSLLNTDFRDMSNNFLSLNPNIGYDSNTVNTVTSGVTTTVFLQAFNDLNLDAQAPTGVAQQEVDDNGQDEFPILVQASNVFNDTLDGTNFRIDQLNSADDDNANGVADARGRIVALGQAIDPSLASVRVNEPRTTFTPSGAAGYILNVQRAGVDVSFAIPQVSLQGDPTGSQLTNLPGQGVIYTPTSASNVTPVEFTLLTGIGIIPGDVLTITPLDDLGYAGTSGILTFRDNVKPTAVLQRSYGLGNTANGSNTVVQYGQGGQLSQISGSITPGLPYLAVTVGLLDNLGTGGATVNGSTVTPNNILDFELAAFDKKFDNDANPATPDQSLFDLGSTNLYDSTAYPLMPKNRTVGVSFSEDVSLNGITPATTGITVTMNNWTENNDVTISENGVNVNVDLIDFDASDVITLGNVDARVGAVIDYTGISDNAGNVADAETNAKVVLLDRMAPMVTKAYFDGTNVVVTFNEDVALRATDTVTINGKVATYDAVNWSVAGNVVTIDGTDFGAGLTVGDFVLGQYAEAAYGANAYEHAAMLWTIGDLDGNDWVNESTGITPPQFAAVETVGNFVAIPDNSGYNVTAVGAVPQTIIWTFNHPIVTGAGELFTAGCGTTLAEPANAALIDAWLEFANPGAAPLTPQYTNVSISLDATCKIMTLNFDTPSAIVAGDTIRSIAGQEFTSQIDPTQKEANSRA